MPAPTDDQIQAVAHHVSRVKQITAQRDGAQAQLNNLNKSLATAQADLEKLRATLSVVS